MEVHRQEEIEVLVVMLVVVVLYPCYYRRNKKSVKHLLMTEEKRIKPMQGLDGNNKKDKPCI